MELYKSVENEAEFLSQTGKEPAVIAYFSTESCSVCKVLKPKLGGIVKEYFPKMNLLFIDVELHPEIAARYNVFVSPTLLAFFDGQECLRRSRAIDTEQLIHDLSRYYRILFS